MCCGMFCLDGEVIFIRSKHVNKIVSSTLVLVFTCGLLKEYLRFFFFYDFEFAAMDSKKNVLGLKTFPLIT